MMMLVAAVVMAMVGTMAMMAIMMAMALSMAMLTPTMAMQASPLSAVTPPSSDPLCTLHLRLKISVAFCWGDLTDLGPCDLALLPGAKSWFRQKSQSQVHTVFGGPGT